MLTFNHFNFNVSDLDKSLAFYKEALDLVPVGERKVAEDGSFIIVYLGDGKTDFRLELTALTLWRGEENVRLSRKECDLLELLIRNRKLVLSKESILVKIWGYESEAEDNNVEVYISFLRRKLARLHSTVKIRTIRMAGYCLEEA